MRVVLFSEDFPIGIESHWPGVPREGDTVALGGTQWSSNQVVDEVRWRINVDGTFHSAEVHLARQDKR